MPHIDGTETLYGVMICEQNVYSQNILNKVFIYERIHNFLYDAEYYEYFTNMELVPLLFKL